MDLKNRILQVLAQHGGIRMAILFGSLATSRATPRSDLDLAVLMDSRLSAETKMALIGNLSRTIGRPVDLVGLNVAGEPLLGQTFDALADSGLIPFKLAMRMKKAAGFRNIAVHNYKAIDWKIVHAIVTRQSHATPTTLPRSQRLSSNQQKFEIYCHVV